MLEISKHKSECLGIDMPLKYLVLFKLDFTGPRKSKDNL